MHVQTDIAMGSNVLFQGLLLDMLMGRWIAIVPREAEVDELHATFIKFHAAEKVAGLDIAVYDTARVDELDGVQLEE